MNAAEIKALSVVFIIHSLFTGLYNSGIKIHLIKSYVDVAKISNAMQVVHILLYNILQLSEHIYRELNER